MNEAPDVLSNVGEEPMAQWEENGGFNLHAPDVVNGFFLQRWIHYNFWQGLGIGIQSGGVSSVHELRLKVEDVRGFFIAGSKEKGVSQEARGERVRNEVVPIHADEDGEDHGGDDYNEVFHSLIT